MTSLRTDLIRLAYQHKKIRPSLLPLLKESARPVPLPYQAIKELSREIGHTLVKRIPKNDRQLGSNAWVQNAPLAVLSSYVNKDPIVRGVKLFILSKPSSSGLWILNGALGTQKTTKDHVLIIHINGSLDGLQYHTHLDFCLKQGKLTGILLEFYKVLIHELTHLKEHPTSPPSATQKKEVADPSQMDLKTYYNNRSEVSAYLQEIIQEVKEKIHIFGQILEIFPQDKAIVYFLKLLPTWMEVREYLESKNKKRVLKAIYTYLQENHEGFA